MSEVKTLKRALNTLFCLSAVASLTAVPLAVAAEQGQPQPVPGANAPTVQDMSAEEARFALVRLGDEILRVDRRSGTVSFCRKSHGAWSCRPAPLADDAYLAEIAELNDAVDRLTARVSELEADLARARQPDIQGALPGEGDAAPQAGSDTPAVPPSADAEQPPADAAKPTPPLSEEDEQQLERMMLFSEKAMRRFFGLMRDLQTELKGE